LADSLKVEIDVNAAKEALKSLGKEVTNLGTSLSGLSATGTKQFGSIAKATAQIKPIDASVIASFENLAKAAATLSGMAELKGLTSEIKKLSSLDPSKVTNAFMNLKRALDGIHVPPALVQLPGTLNSLNASLTGVAQHANQTAKAVNNLGQQASSAKGSVDGFGSALGGVKSILAAFGVVMGAQLFADFIKGSFDAVTAMDKFNNTVKATSGSVTAVGDEFKFVSDVSARTATDIGALIDSYGKFSGAAKLAGASLQDVHDIFEATATAGRVLKLSGDDMKLTFLALEQMFSKGKVSTEELRRQFGERIPGAFALAAKAMGVTTAELDKMLRNGDVLATDLLPKLAVEMNKAFSGGLEGAVKSAQAAMTRFTNSVWTLQEAFGRSFFDAFKNQLNDLAATMSSTEGVDAFAAMGKTLGTVVGAMINVIDGFIAGIKTLGETFTWIAGVVGTLLSPIGSLINFFAPGATSADAFAGALKAVGAALTVIIGVAVVNYFTELVKGFFAAEAATKGFAAALRLVMLNPIILGISAVVAAVALYEKGMSDAAEANKKMRDATAPTAKGLAEMSPALQSVREEAGAMAVQVGMGAEEAGKFADEMTLAAATPSQLSDAIQKNISTLKEFKTNLDENIAKMKENAVAIIQAALADGKIDDAERERIQTIQGTIKAMEDKSTTMGQSIAVGQAQVGQLKSEAAAHLDTTKAVKALTDANKDGKTTYEEATKAIEGQVPAAEAAGKSFSGFVQYLFSANSATQTATQGVQQVNTELKKVPDATKPAGEGLNQFGEKAKSLPEQGKELLDFLKQGASGIASFLQNILGITPAAAQGADGFGSLAKGAGDVTDPLQKAGDAGKAAGEGLSKTGEDTQSLGSALGDVSGVADQFKTAMAALLAPIANFQQAVTGLSGELTKTSGTVTSNQQSWTTWGTTLSTLAASMNTVAASMTAIATALTPISSTLPTVNDQMVTTGTNAMTANTGLQPFSNSINIISLAVGVLASTLPVVSAAFASLGTSMTTIQGAVDAVVVGFNRLPEAVAKVSELGEVITALGSKAEQAKTASSSLVSSFDEIVGSTGRASGGLNSLNNALDANISKLDDTGNAVDRLIDKYNKLAEAAKKAMDAANAADSAGGGGGGGSSDAQRYGGYSGYAMESVPTSASDFSNAPKLASGISNTNKLLRKMSGGGIPTILHPNEAVVPLPKGRNIPVELSYTNMPKAPDPVQVPDASTAAAIPADFMNDLSKLTTAISALSDGVKSMAEAPAQMADTTPKKLDVNFVNPPQANEARTNSGTRTAEATANTDPNTTDSKPVQEIQSRGPTIINVEIRASDYDSFKRSEDQIARDLGNKINKATRRIGGR